MNEGFHQPSRVFIKAGREELYRFQVEHASLDPFIKTLLRSYGGILTDFTPINENEIARRSGLPAAQVSTNLKYLEKVRILDYLPQTDRPQILYSQERVDTRYLVISREHYHDRKAAAEKRLGEMISYAESDNKCRSQVLLAYFGELNQRRCGKCDVCIERNKISLNDMEFSQIVDMLKPVLKARECTLEEMVAVVEATDEDKVLRALQWLIENEKIVMTPGRKYKWNQ